MNTPQWIPWEPEKFPSPLPVLHCSPCTLRHNTVSTNRTCILLADPLQY